MQQGLGRSNVRSLAHQVGGQAYRQIHRQFQFVEAELRELTRVARIFAHQDGQQVSRLGQCLLQRRQGGLCPGQLGLLGENIGLGNTAQLELALNKLVGLPLIRQDLLCRLQLGAQRGFPDGSGDNIGRQCQIGALKLKILIIHLGLKCLQFPPRTTEDIEQIGDIHRGIVKRENIAATRGLPEGCGAETLPAGRKTSIDRRIPRNAELGPEILLRLAQTGLGRSDRGIIVQCLANQLIQGFGMEQQPPLSGNSFTFFEVLGVAASHRSGLSLIRQGRGRKVLCVRSLRRLELRAYSASHQQCKGHRRCPQRLAVKDPSPFNRLVLDHPGIAFLIKFSHIRYLIFTGRTCDSHVSMENKTVSIASSGYNGINSVDYPPSTRWYIHLKYSSLEH